MGTDPHFVMTVKEIFSIADRGTVVTGTIENGIIEVGDEVQLKRANSTMKLVMSGIEISRKLTLKASEGDTVGLLISDLTRDEVQRGDILTCLCNQTGYLLQGVQ